MPEIHLKQTGFIYSFCGPCNKVKNEYKNSKKKQEIQNIFTEMS